ncbi:MAG: YggS family pyridoxal phosphate-dependent enzyme [Clostridia bacterium]|nr:YggS family pyridoxal phosphate-dependent enzyme [Clostridia bacterium]
MSIKQNLEKIKTNINTACEKCGRNPEDVTILAVTKTRSADEINEVIDLGIVNIGENRVQELIAKYDSVSEEARWHLIGHLQKNKVKYIADKVCMIHSVDSPELAEEIDRRCKKINKTMDILIEVNISGEETKSGISPDKIRDFINLVSSFDNIKIRGLMTMAPKYAPDEELHRIFSGLATLAKNISDYENVSMDYLSMGMSGDYEAAICEGSNIVRIGTALFQ